ncbi:hypothetical protein SAPIO_CDS5915 [Scedosporium apiospermum]|uniref:Uncharacterized protein n=1 Tax=Pseudallescheria apiosperma TaxID=563466 RepID=A0A084G5P7_PSEDA|nr:uncharacterized protein SAPIO_CDS5915 [Scedosporium apiospermum]KEZ42659.1 hypothetical protein SAPIO_CDS5915 [Scedosporium apiospermum]
MAAEVSQAPLEGQLDTDLTFGGDLGRDTGLELPESNESAVGITEAERFSADPASKATDSLNEIDWEEHPQPNNNDESPAELELNDTTNGSAPHSSFDVHMDESEFKLDASADAVVNAGGEQEEGEAENGGFDDDGGGDASNLNDNSVGEEVVEHEINYDEEEDDEKLDADIEVEDVSLEYPPTPDQGAESHVHSDAEDVSEEISHDVEEEKDEDEDQSEQVAAPDDHSTDESEDDQGELPTSCPDISVTYRSQEYPLIHGQNNADVQMGFFEDVAVLDLTVDNLLSRFRQELVDDLGEQDELVLQVDELGLEYAESTQRDHLSGVTLRQLHEIFDQLVKNQDPDASRPLYTNLIVRPHPAKRLELLIDEAFNGKGLDEIIYWFQPNVHGQAGHTESNVDMNADVSSDGDGADEYISGDAEEEEVSANDDLVSEQDDEEISENEPEPSGDDRDDDITEDQYYDNGSRDLDEVEDTADHQYADEVGMNELTEEQTELLESAQDNEALINDLVAADVTEVEEVATSNDKVHDDLTTEQPADEVLDEGFDLIEMIDDDDNDGALELGQADAADSSATATLDGHADNEIDYDDHNVNGDAIPDIGESAIAGEPLEEIDWRDFPDENDASNEKETLSVSGKRPHSEINDGEEFDLDNENDVKRRRS